MDTIAPHVLKLISAYLTNNISEEEFFTLKKWVYETKANKQLFLDYLTFYKKSRRIGFIEFVNKDKAWNEIVLKLEKPIDYTLTVQEKTVKVRVLKRFSKVFKYAAIAILFLGVGYFYTQDFFEKKQVVVNSTKSITLQLENGDIEIINTNGETEVVDANGNIIVRQKGSKLTYNRLASVNKLEYNTLTVPYGERFEIQLSDGTYVHLNSGTSLKYPIKFIEGKDRQVFLNGEAYFKVAKDAKHPFIVNSDDVNVRVLGTQFNMSSYPEDIDIQTVLVEGSVSVYSLDTEYSPESSTILKPGFMAKWDKESGNVTLEKADIEMHTAWVDGRVVFRRVAFKNIIKKLERYYNVEIINNNLELEEHYFAASFDNETIEEIFKSFNEIHPIDYVIEKNKIVIK